MIGIKNILVATDFGEAAEAALRYGEELSRKFDAKLHVLTVVDDVGARTTVASGLPIALDDIQRQMEMDAQRALQSLLEIAFAAGDGDRLAAPHFDVAA